jgi:hypothetical protein
MCIRSMQEHIYILRLGYLETASIQLPKADQLTETVMSHIAWE